MPVKEVSTLPLLPDVGVYKNSCAQEPGERKAGGMVPSSSAAVQDDPEEQEYYREWLPIPVPQPPQQHPPRCTLTPLTQTHLQGRACKVKSILSVPSRLR